MCGINGVFFYGERGESRELIASMNQALQHRGPDAEGNYIKDYIGLGHRRLAIIDLDESSNQPYLSNDKRYVLIFNGEIYNYREIRSKLNDYSFKTNSDTEVILAAYLKWGKSCLAEFNGMFAFAIWDEFQKELFIARDRLGIKPLYYYNDNQAFLFSSELRALLRSGMVPKRINENALSEYFRYQTVFAPRTIVKNVSMLQAGEYMVLNEEGAQTYSYWKAEKAEKSGDFSNIENNKREIRRLFFEAVEKRLIADVPFGAFLSGGIDSSAIVAAMSEVSTSVINTFNISFKEKEFSEEKYANIVADKFGTNHHTIRLEPADFLNDIPYALSCMDHPSGDGLNTYTVSKVTKEAGITVALSGLGGDELFSGYPIFRQIDQLEAKKWLQSWPKGIRSTAGYALRQIKPSVKSDKIHEFLKQDYYDLESIYPLGRQLYLEPQLRKILSKKPTVNNIKQLVREKTGFRSVGDNLPLQSKVSVLEFYTYMQNVLLRDADQMSMAHALEVRVPFLDHHLVEYLLNVPDKHKLEGFPKKLLVDSLGDLLPKEVYQREKMGFVFPWEHWMRNEIRELVEEKVEFLCDTQVVQKEYAHKIWKQFLKGDSTVNWVMIWCMVSLASWMKENGIDG